MKRPLPAGVRSVRPHRTGAGLNVLAARLDTDSLADDTVRLIAAMAPRRHEPELTFTGGEAVFASAPYEAEIVAAELDAEHDYLLRDRRLAAPTVVLDIGAHIGLFTMRVLHRYPRARVIAVEPFGPSYRALVENIRLRGVADSVTAVRAAVADRSGTADISGCAGTAMVASIMAGQQPLLTSTRATVRRSLPALLRRGGWGAATTEWAVEDLLATLLTPTVAHVPRQTVSDLIRRHTLGRISLLKIDVEGAETLVLDGIEPYHWARIDAVVAEVARPLLPAVCATLRERGFHPVVSRTALVSSSFGAESVVVRAGRRTPDTRAPGGEGPAPAPDRHRAAVEAVTGLIAQLRAMARQVGPSGEVLLDVCADPASGPLVLPWSEQRATLAIRHGRSWARYFVDAYLATDHGIDRLSQVFGGDWSGLARHREGRPIHEFIAARMSAARMFAQAVGASVKASTGACGQPHESREEGQ